MTASTSIRPARRLNHGLAHLATAEPAQIVGWFGAMQAQDYAASRWALGVRNPALDDAAVQRAIDTRRIVRTWALRNTLHLVAADDVHWLLRLVGPILLVRNAAMFRAFGLDGEGFAPVRAALEDVLQGRQLTREALFAALTARGIDVEGQRGSRILYRAGLGGCVCLASLHGKQPTYALLDEWITPAPALERDAALGELAVRYFRSHGPASVRDFAWWSGMGAADARRALSIAQARLCLSHADPALWSAPAPEATVAGAQLAHLLPPFDEFFLGYEDRSLTLSPEHFATVMTVNGLFRATVLVGDEIVGTWARELASKRVHVTCSLFRPLDAAEQRAVQAAAERYAAFLGATLAQPPRLTLSS